MVHLYLQASNILHTQSLLYSRLSLPPARILFTAVAHTPGGRQNGLEVLLQV